jgi:hypothetical protein
VVPVAEQEDVPLLEVQLKIALPTVGAVVFPGLVVAVLIVKVVPTLING